MLNAKIVGKKLVIEVDLEEPYTTLKSKVIASSHGNQKTSLLVEGKPLVIGVNTYIPLK